MTTLEEFGVDCPEPADQRSELERRRDQMTQCTATKGDGEQCQNKARGEHEQCGIHRPADEDNRCIAYTDDEDRCRNAQGYDSDYCHPRGGAERGRSMSRHRRIDRRTVSEHADVQ